MNKSNLSELLEERLGEKSSFIDYDIRDRSSIIDIKLNGELQNIGDQTLEKISEIFVDKLNGDYGLAFTDDPPRGLPDKMSGNDEGVYIAVMSKPNDFIGYVYTYGAYLDTSVSDLSEVVEDLGHSATHSQFVEAMTEHCDIQEEDLLSVVNETYNEFEPDDNIDDSAFDW